VFVCEFCEFVYVFLFGVQSYENFFISQPPHSEKDEEIIKKTSARHIFFSFCLHGLRKNRIFVT